MQLKNFTLFVLLSLTFTSIYAQKRPIEVIYHSYSNGKKNTNFEFSLKYQNGITYLSKEKDKTQSFIDYNQNSVVDIITYNENLYKTVEAFDKLPKAKLTNETEKILGYTCKKAIFSAFSNKIEVWYTTKTKAKGSPYKSYLPENSLVLKIIFNGSREIIATKIKKAPKKTILKYLTKEASKITMAEYREIQIKSRYTTVPVFEKQQVNFEGKIINPEFNKSNTTYRFSNGTVLLKKIKLPKINKEGASVFATITNWSNGDAYDRTCSLFTISDAKKKSVIDAFEKGLKELPIIKDNLGKEYQGIISTSNYDVPIELMRFFTSFGVNHFNKKREINNYKWQDSVVYKQEITSLIPNTQDEIWVGVFIGNYDKGGHKVSVDLNFYPSWTKEAAKPKWINPIFNTTNILEMSGQNYGRLFKNDTLKTTFDVPKNIDNLNLLFTSTGHGGWGKGDEFVPKLNQIFIDGKLAFTHVPWRSDCGTYRMSNPASGNFRNGLSSSDLSRSNWCPATVTPPYIIPLKNLKPGKHTIEVVIDQGDDEGSSFNSWNVSGILTGTKNN